MLRCPRPLWTSTKAPRRVARPNLRDFFIVVGPVTLLMTSFVHPSVFLLSPFPISNSMAPSRDMSVAGKTCISITNVRHVFVRSCTQFSLCIPKVLNCIY